MCRNIKRLRRDDPPVTRADFEEAARNFVRKLSGYPKPSAANRDVCDAATRAIAEHALRLFARLGVEEPEA
jgi:hypothetical protein